MNYNQIYLLWDNHGNLKRCGLTLDDVTSYLKKDEFTSNEWNSIFRSEIAEERQKVYESKGWTIQKLHVESPK